MAKDWPQSIEEPFGCLFEAGCGWFLLDLGDLSVLAFDSSLSLKAKYICLVRRPEDVFRSWWRFLRDKDVPPLQSPDYNGSLGVSAAIPDLSVKDSVAAAILICLSAKDLQINI